MAKRIKKISAVILLVVLIGVPFINWRLGAVLWMCAWLIFILQQLYGQHGNSGEETGGDDELE